MSCQNHDFQDVEELHKLRENLLSWYDANKRDLPWRSLSNGEVNAKSKDDRKGSLGSRCYPPQAERDKNTRAYGVWVSEIMLQQARISETTV